MTSRDFCFWLQGFFEIDGVHASNNHGLSMEEVDIIKKHLSLVFKHEIDPSMGNQAHQDELNQIHHTPQILGDWETLYGPCPHPGWEVSLHGWYDPEGAVPRC